MLRDKERSLLFIQIFTDVLIVAISWFFAFAIRFYVMTSGQLGLELFFIKLTPVVIMPTLYFFRQNGLYKSLRFATRYKEIMAVFTSCVQGTLALVLLLYFFAPERISRIMILIFGFSAPLMLIISRMMIRNTLRALRRKGYNLRHYLLIGNSRQMRDYIQLVKKHKDAGIRFIGIIEGDDLAKEFDLPILNMEAFAAIEKISPDAIIVGPSSHKAELIEDILRKFHDDIVPIHVLPDITYSLVGTKVEDLFGIPILTLNAPNITLAGFLSKRAFDFVVTGIGLILISPLLLIIGVLVKLTSKGPIFYAQRRMGLDGLEFKMWKFRSMRVADNPQEKPGWTVENDPRRTKFGSFLRKTSLDELPQIWNVFVGDMSLVGPRPEQPHFVDKFRGEIPAYMLRHKMKAGITGWAQINGWRGDTSIERRIECDIYYIKNWSLLLDIKILFLTFWKVFVNKNAY